MEYVFGQVAGYGLVDVMKELLYQRELAVARETVAHMEGALRNERVRTQKLIERLYQRLARVEIRAASVRYDMALLEMEHAEEQLENAREEVDG